MHPSTIPPRRDTGGAGLIPYGWSDDVASAYHPFQSPSLIPGRVVRVDRGGCTVATDHGLRPCEAGGPARAPGSEPPPAATGDWAALEPWPDGRLGLAAIVPRRTAIRRGDPDGSGYQVLAANVDIVLVVVGIDRPLRAGRVERLLVIAWESGAIPVVAITKTDLAADGFADVTDFTTGVAAAAPGVEVVPLSGATGEGVDRLAGLLAPGTTAALVGESGAGKSTLANRLLGSPRLDTGPTRRGDAKGRHTTTARELVVTPSGAILIDTPGLRAVGLADGGAGIDLAFPDIDALAAGCRFRDCGHRCEPGCAVAAAVERGDLSPRRLQSYRKLEREVEHEMRRADVRARRTETRTSKRRYRRSGVPEEDW
ncbi:MAG: ribosome small subunit-dependent GTPase A [Actinobacteria bacterium]|nr:ribosome small subunit-dependent GTPase A [Actinomycetota bacterium]